MTSSLLFSFFFARFSSRIIGGDHMKYVEALTLKEGDLVIIDANRNTHYGGLILEIESFSPEHDNWCRRVTLKQPNFNGGFRIENYDSRLLKRYES